MRTVQLADQDLLLRCWRADDAPAVFEACQDAEIQRWTTVPVPYLIEHAETFVGQAAGRWEAGMPQFGVFDATAGTLLGAHGFVAAPEADVYEIGYWVAAGARARGVATRATRMVCRFAFDAVGAARMEWQAEVGNWPSRRVAERVGFTIEGTLRQRLAARGMRRDAWIGGLLPDELI